LSDNFCDVCKDTGTLLFDPDTMKTMAYDEKKKKEYHEVIECPHCDKDFEFEVPF